MPRASAVWVVALVCCCISQSHLVNANSVPSSSDLLQTLLGGVGNLDTAAQQISKSLMENYQQTVQDLLTSFTQVANKAGSLKQQANTQVTATTADVVGTAESAITAGVNTANQIYSKLTDNTLPVIGQVANGVNYLVQSAQDAASQVKNLYEAYQDAYCTPAQYTPPAMVPANLTGPGFTLTFAMGNCTFDEKQLLSKDGAIQCAGPSVSLDRTPTTFTSAYRSAATFVGEQCELSKSFGNSTTEILYVFDPKTLASDPMPLQSIAQYLEKELQGLLKNLGVQDKLTSAETAATQAVQAVQKLVAPVLSTPSTVATSGAPSVVSAAGTPTPTNTPWPLISMPVLPNEATPPAGPGVLLVPAAAPPAASKTAASPTVVTVPATTPAPSSPEVNVVPSSPPSGTPSSPEVITVPGSAAAPPTVYEIVRPGSASSAAAAAPPGVSIITVPASPSPTAAASPPDVRIITVPVTSGG